MVHPKHQQDTLPTDDPEVRAYLKRLLGAMFLGLVLVTITAVWAWNKYAPRLADAPPLPSGTPPISDGPITTR